MTNFIPYIIKLSISLSIVYLFYQLCLRRLTFHNWNRWYLLLYSMTCFLIPLIKISSTAEQSLIVQYIPIITDQDLTKHAVSFSWTQLYFIVVIAGIVLFAIRLLAQCISLLSMRSKAKLLYNNDVKLYHIDKPVIPFSFGNAIYINQHQHSQQELSDIIRHEFIHVKQRHTIDMIWSELLCIVNWYNPFAWLLRRAIRQNLEFVADNQVLESGLDRKQYQYLLLKVIGTPSYSIASNFNFSSLKKRIAMMNKTKSARVNLLRFAFILPLLSVFVLAFRTIHQHEPTGAAAAAPAVAEELVFPVPFENHLLADTTPAPKAEATATDRTSKTKTSLIKPDEIKSMTVLKENGQQIIIIELNDGTQDVFDLTNPADRKRFAAKYGEPVPAAAPAPPVVANVNEQGYINSVADNNGECVVIVKNQHGQIVKAMPLTDWDKNKKVWEQTYGPIPPKRIRPVPAAAHPSISITPAKPATPAAEAAPAKAAEPAAAPVAPDPDRQVAYRDPMPPNPTFELLIRSTTSGEEFEHIHSVLESYGLWLKIEDAEYSGRQLMRFNARYGGPGQSAGGGLGVIDLSNNQAFAIVGYKDENGKNAFKMFVKSLPSVL